MTAPVATGTGAEPEPGRPAEQSPPVLSEDPPEPAPPRHRMGPFAAIVAVVAVLAVAAGVFVYVNHRVHARTKVAYQVAAVFKLRPGECFNSGQNGVNLTLRSCSAPHDAEVFARFTIPGSAWPGDSTLQAKAESGCMSRLAGYMNPALATTALDQEYIYPDALAWRAGVHAVICDVRSEAGPITGSVRQTS
jgi:hypothetical protein